MAVIYNIYLLVLCLSGVTSLENLRLDYTCYSEEYNNGDPYGIEQDDLDLLLESHSHYLPGVRNSMKRKLTPKRISKRFLKNNLIKKRHYEEKFAFEIC